MTALSDPLVQETLRGSFRLAAPEIVLLATACSIFLLGAVYNRRWLWFLVSLIGVGAAAAIAAGKTAMPEAITASPLIPDAMAGFIRWLAIAFAAIYLLISLSETDRTNAAEYFGCSLVAAAGVSLAGRANDLVTLFLALELLSIPTYVLLYLPAKSKANQEAALKYFFLSILSSAVLLFGFSYLYGLAGSTNLTAIAGTLAKANAERLSPMALVAAVMVIAGLGFRITAVPFHFYAPDVYQGGPTGVVAQIAFWPKVVGMVAFVRLLGLVSPDPLHPPFDSASQVPLLLWILAVITMTLGNVLALLQDNIRRMFAYSGVAHGGYLLMGLVSASALGDAKSAPSVGGVEAILVYLAAYGAMTVGAFAVLQYLNAPEQPVESIDDLAGIGRSHPVSAACLAIFLFSMIGLPLTAGFVGKFLLFLGVLGSPTDTATMRDLYQWLALAAAVNAAIGAVYYLRVVGVMYLRTALRPAAKSKAWCAALAATVLAAATLVVGFYPQPLVKAARKAAPVPSIAR
ncbi:MAG: NADH-quinone oxidoreductase subunit N [Gemmataceae bacterium]